MSRWPLLVVAVSALLSTCPRGGSAAAIAEQQVEAQSAAVVTTPTSTSTSVPTPALVQTPAPVATAAAPTPTLVPVPATGPAPAPVGPIETTPSPTPADVAASVAPAVATSPSGSTGPPMTTVALPAAAEDEVPEEPELLSPCVNLDEVHCPPTGELCRCKLINGTASVICCDVTTQLQLMESLNCHGLAGANITALHARNITLHSLDVGVLDSTRLSLPQLESLAITDGHIIEIKGTLNATNLACMNLSSNSLINVSNDNTFLSLPSLANLDLSGNDLQHVYNITANVSEFNLDISGNNRLACDSILDLMKKMKNVQFSHDNTTYCLTPRTFHWFNTTERIPLASVVMINKLEQECPEGETGPCLCSTVRLEIVPGKPPIFSVSVDCSNRRLTSLPETLPKNTITLNVSSNNISNLSALSMNAAYAGIRMFYADDNQITSITGLEGSTFINNFQILSLRSNNISSLPTYILSNVFDRNNWIAQTVYLGLNRLKCDCSTAQSIKMWLNANNKHIPDFDAIMCENMPERVFELDQNKVCTVQSDWTEYVYYLVALEVFLLILLISKVSYDYWVFKTAGYLPWPASKMPKLPCDWVFES